MRGKEDVQNTCHSLQRDRIIYTIDSALDPEGKPLINLTNQQTLPREDNGSNPSTVVARFGTEEGRICKDNQQTLPCLGRIMGQIPGLPWPDLAKKKAAGARRRLGVASGTAYRIQYISEKLWYQEDRSWMLLKGEVVCKTCRLLALAKQSILLMKGHA